MLKTQTKQPEIEQKTKSTYADANLGQVFTDFLLEKRIKSDIQQSLAELKTNQVFTLDEVIQEAKAVYESTDL